MADIFSILSSNYLTVGSTVSSGGKYVAVDPDSFQGNWTGKYGDGKSFSFQISDVNGFRAKVKYQSGSTVQYQNVLIRDNSFRIGDSKFALSSAGNAQIGTVVTDPVSGSTTLLNAYATQG